MSSTGGNILVPVLAAALAVGGSFAGTYFGFLGKDRELDVRMVEVSLSILAGENSGTRTEQARRFALRALSKYSGIPLSEQQINEWTTSGEISFGAIPSFGDGGSPGWAGGGGDDGGSFGTSGGDGGGSGAGTDSGCCGESTNQ